MQASHDTPVGSLLEYAAGLAGIPAVYTAILHPNAGSLDAHGPNIGHVPGLSLWDRVTVHRWVYVDILSFLRRQGTQGRIQTRSLGCLQMLIRMDATGMQVWRRIMLQVQREHFTQTPGREAHLVPHTLEITSPATTIWWGRRTLWETLDVPLGAAHLEVRAHFTDTVACSSAMTDLLELYHQEVEAREEARLENRPAGPLLSRLSASNSDIEIPPTQPWPPPMARTINQALRGGALPAAPSGSATEWAAFLDSISGPSSDYNEALIMARRTVPPAAGQPVEGALSHEDIRSVGWSAFTNWATLRQVIRRWVTTSDMRALGASWGPPSWRGPSHRPAIWTCASARSPRSCRRELLLNGLLRIEAQQSRQSQSCGQHSAPLRRPYQRSSGLGARNRSDWRQHMRSHLHLLPCSAT